MKGFRVFLELDNWPPGTPLFHEYRANIHATGPDGSLFLSLRVTKTSGVLAPGVPAVEITQDPVVTLRGGAHPLWRIVNVVDLPDEELQPEDDGQPDAEGSPIELPWHQRISPPAGG